MYWKDPEFGSVYGVAPKLDSYIDFSTSRQHSRVGALLVSHLTNFLWDMHFFTHLNVQELLNMYWKGPKFGSVYGVALKLALEIYFSTSRQNGRVGALLVSHLTNFLWERFNFHSECARTFEYVLEGPRIRFRIRGSSEIGFIY